MFPMRNTHGGHPPKAFRNEDLDARKNIVILVERPEINAVEEQDLQDVYEQKGKPVSTIPILIKTSK
jgi:hypothetical protein